jgi:putative nucleotidyltransferase with HDIG domain
MAESEYAQYLDGSYQLMEQFKKICPGSQKHCMNVAIFCESIAKEVGFKNPDVIKCAALFHDIGKIINPGYFIENISGGQNPHDKINDPYLSYQIISRHIADTALILLQHKFPPEIIDIATEHHGDSLVKYFYEIALKSHNNDLHPTELQKNYRYKSKKPQCTESAVLLICDRVEATARSKFSNGNFNQDCISALISECVTELIDDSQLDNLRIGTLKKIKLVLNKELSSMYHPRILYDKEEDDTTIGEVRADKL